MIKKINIFLLVVFAALFALKFVREAADSSAKAPVASVSAGPVERGLDVTVYSDVIPPYTAPDVIARHNGLFIDLLASIFPRLKISYPDEESRTNWWHRALTTDPRAVALASPVDPLFADYPKTRSPLGSMELHLLTPRKSPRRYRPGDSFRGWRLAIDVTGGADAFVNRLVDGGVLTRLDTLPKESTFEDFLRANAYDGLLVPLFVTDVIRFEDLSTGLSEDFRRSDVVTRVPCHLAVSKLDPAFVERFLREFEEGLRRIEASGERRRILEYYGLSDEETVRATTNGVLRTASPAEALKSEPVVPVAAPDGQDARRPSDPLP